MSKREFYFPVLFWRPAEEFDSVAKGNFALIRRLWETSVFDLATLATKHCLHLPYQLMDVLLSRCNLELRVEAEDLDRALGQFNALLLGFYLTGASPSLAPFAASHSVNSYSGINSRDSDILRKDLPPQLQEGPSSNDVTVEVWPVQLSLHCKVLPGALDISPTQFQEAAEKAGRWIELEAKQLILRIVREAVQTAPIIPSIDQSLLHIWSALEALFPRVNIEVSFRLALYLAQLISTPDKRKESFERVRKGYGVRSKVAHGSLQGVSDDEWIAAWGLLCDVANAIVVRGRLPSEEELLQELFSAGG